VVKQKWQESLHLSTRPKTNRNFKKGVSPYDRASQPFKHVAQLIKNRGSVAHRLYNFSNATTVAHARRRIENN